MTKQESFRPRRAPVTELLLFACTASSGLYALLTLVNYLQLRYLHRPLHPSYSNHLNPLVALFLCLPLFFLSHGKLYWLRTARLNGCELANVYPHRDPILGTDWIIDLKKAMSEVRLIETLDSYFRDIGNTYWFHSVGEWSINTNEPENIKAILSTQFDIWPIQGLRKTTSVLTLGPRAIFSVNGREWQHARSLIRPSFVRNQLADLECTDRHVDNFLAKLPRDGSKIDLQPLFYLFTMDVSTDFMFGHSTDMLVTPAPEAKAFIQAFESVLLSAVSRGRLGWLMLLLPDKKFNQASAACRSFIDKYVASALSADKGKERQYVFMNELVDSGASHQEIREQLLSMILGGRDTSASTMTSLFWVLSRRPDIVGKLREELGELNGEKPTWEKLKGMKYLNNVLKEVLRLYPPVTSNLRSASRDTILPRGGGKDGQSPLFVPKGTSCRYSISNMQRRIDLYGPDAEEFVPERWDNLRTSWEYIPFSGGPRICIGQQFALTQMSYMIARILQVFDVVKAADDLPMQQVVSTTTCLKNGCWVTLSAA